MPQPNVLDLVRLLVDGKRDDAVQMASMAAGTLPWISHWGGEADGVGMDPEGRMMPMSHPAWNRDPETPIFPYLNDWIARREKQLGRTLEDPRFPGRPLRPGGRPPGFADGGLAGVDLLAQPQDVPYPQYTDWYQRLYGPYGSQVTNALPPGYVPPGVPGWSGLDHDWLGGVGVAGQGAGPGTGAGSGPTVGVADTQDSPGMQAVMAAIGAVSPVPGVVSGLSTIANMLAPMSTIGVPGIATVDVGTGNVNADIAAIAAQTQAAQAAGIGAQSNAGEPGVGQPGPAPTTADVTVGPNEGQAGETGPSAGVGSGVGAAATGPDATDSGGWARGGYLSQAMLRRPTSHRPIRRAALGHLSGAR